jgi:hypothetical protein
MILKVNGEKISNVDQLQTELSEMGIDTQSEVSEWLNTLTDSEQLEVGKMALENFNPPTFLESVIDFFGSLFI